jgi:hypothetical protein
MADPALRIDANVPGDLLVVSNNDATTEGLFLIEGWISDLADPRQPANSDSGNLAAHKAREARDVIERAGAAIKFLRRTRTTSIPSNRAGD